MNIHAVLVLKCMPGLCKVRWPKSVMAISICSWQFNLITAISTCSRQFQFNHGNFNLFTAISICSRQFQLVHSNFNFPKQFQFFNGNAHGIFRFTHHLSTSASDSGHQRSKRKTESRYLKSIFKVKIKKMKVHSQTLIWWPVNIYCTASQNGSIPHINPSIEATSKSCLLMLLVAVFLFLL